MVPRHDSEVLEGMRVVERGRSRCREEAARRWEEKQEHDRGTHAGAGEAGARRRKSSAGEAKPTRGIPLALTRGEGNRARERRSLRAGFHWRRGAEKEIQRGRGEACARVSIGAAAADSKRASHAKNGQRRLRDGKR